MLIKNNTKKPAKVGRYTVPAEGTCEVPDNYNALWQPRAQGMLSRGELVFPYADPEEAETAEIVLEEAPAPESVPDPPEVVEPPKAPQDLTDLVHIGVGRARKLSEAGVTRHEHLVKMGAEALADALPIDLQMAEDVIGDAKRRVPK